MQAEKRFIYGTMLGNSVQTKSLNMKSLITFALAIFAMIIHLTDLNAQTKTMLVDVGHGQKFYSDPADTISTALVSTDRLKYLTGELTKNAAAHDAKVGYLKTPITHAALAKCDLLFVHVPVEKFSDDESAAIQKYVKNGGALFIVIEEDYWATLDQINANDVVKPFGISFGANSPDKTSGGNSTAGKITKKKYSIPSHGARLVQGGTPFAFSNSSDTNPIGVYTEINGGGKIVAMGEGMVSLYMTAWQNVSNYECSGFM